MYLRATEAVAAKLKDPQVVYVVEALSKASTEVPRPVILRGVELDFHASLSNIKLFGKDAHDSDPKFLSCAHFCLRSKSDRLILSAEVRNSI